MIIRITKTSNSRYKNELYGVSEIPQEQRNREAQAVMVNINVYFCGNAFISKLIRLYFRRLMSMPNVLTIVTIVFETLKTNLWVEFGHCFVIGLKVLFCCRAA